jgi:hypothetical protein
MNFLPDVAFKIKFIKLDISNWRIPKIKCRYIGGMQYLGAKPMNVIVLILFSKAKLICIYYIGIFFRYNPG